MRIGLGVICVVLALAGCNKDKDAAKATPEPVDKPAPPAPPPPPPPAAVIDAQVSVDAPLAAVEPGRPAAITDKLLADSDGANQRMTQIVTDLEAAPNCTKALAGYKADIKKFHKEEKAFSAEAGKLDDAAQQWLHDHINKDPINHRFTMALMKCVDDKKFSDGVDKVGEEEARSK
jgi:hypothetical protein